LRMSQLRRPKLVLRAFHKIHKAVPAVLASRCQPPNPRRCGFLGRPAGPPQKRPSFGVRSPQLDLCFIVVRRDGAMGLFLVLFLCAAVARAVLRCNSRFGVFNTRLGPNKFPFPPLRELTGKGLTCLVVFAAKPAVFGQNRENSRFHGNNRECRPPAKQMVAQPAVTPIWVSRARSEELRLLTRDKAIMEGWPHGSFIVARCD